MLLQTNSYIVPRDKRMEHARLLRRFRQTLMRLGCDHFEVYEQVGPNWNGGETTGRFVQIMRFRDRKHQLMVQEAERADAAAQAIVREFCELINFPYQQQQGLFAVGYYSSFLRMPTPVGSVLPASRAPADVSQENPDAASDAAADDSAIDDSPFEPIDLNAEDSMDDENGQSAGTEPQAADGAGEAT